MYNTIIEGLLQVSNVAVLVFAYIAIMKNIDEVTKERSLNLIGIIILLILGLLSPYTSNYLLSESNIRDINTATLLSVVTTVTLLYYKYIRDAVVTTEDR